MMFDPITQKLVARPKKEARMATCARVQAAPQGRLSVTGCTRKAKMLDAWWGSKQRSSLR
jgi:hypothetical protein